MSHPGTAISTRDFLLMRSGGQAGVLSAPPPAVLEWHRALGGSDACWSSRRLQCRLWGPTPATATVWADGTEMEVGCVLTGAPAGVGSLDPQRLQSALLRAYLTDGLSALGRFDGSFCGVLLDERHGAFVFTDRFGFRKAFVARDRDVSYASSRAVVIGRGLGLELDGAGVTSCTLVGHTLGRRTLFASCAAVMPATALELSSGREHLYWDISQFAAERPRDAVATAILGDRFNAACRTLADAQQQPALNITGGFDTRAVLSAALRTERPLVGVTYTSIEKRAVDPIVATSGITHRYYPVRVNEEGGAAAAFALLTDGECDASHGGSGLDHWQRLAAAAPSGCLHGGLGEVWRAYHYKFLWPGLSSIRRDPLGFLHRRLVQSRLQMLPILRADLRREALDVVRSDAESLWRTVQDADGACAAIDAFYLLERQRGLTRVASAADLWNPAYSPFAHSLFSETALGYLGPQNRGDTLHREIISRNAPALARLARHGGGNCLPLDAATRWREAGVATGRHLAGRAAGQSIRRLLKTYRGVWHSTHRLDIDRLAAAGVYDADQLRRVWDGRVDREGSGNVAAVAYLIETPAGEAADLVAALNSSTPACQWTRDAAARQADLEPVALASP